VVAFVTSALLTLILTIVWIIVKPHNDDQVSEPLNPIDHWMWKLCYRRLQDLVINRGSADRASRTARCLQDVILSFSDIQLVTGIAVLVSALVLLKDRSEGGIVIYHFTIATDLAWLSSNIHLLSLVVIGHYLEEEEEKDDHGSRRPIPTDANTKSLLRQVRVTLMLVLASLLLYCVTISGYQDWYDELGCPVLCIKTRLQQGELTYGGIPLLWLIVNYILIFYDYIISIAGAFPSARRKILHPIYRQIQHTPSRRRSLSSWLCAMLAFLVSDLVESLLGIAWFALGLLWLVQDRNRARWQGWMSDDEWRSLGTFGFGQLVPIFLLLLPALTFVESWKGRTKSRNGCETINLRQVR
jgi:hypothetical protein